jgi:prephenate dehydrogenase
MATIGLIGYGRFGRLAARYLSRRATVLVYDSRRGSRPTGGTRVRPATLRQVASLPVVVLAVPISDLRATLRRIAPLCVPGALVMDVCTVKQEPIRWMRRILPRHVAVVGSHPLFGPDSDTGSLRGQRIVLCPARVSKRMLSSIRSTLQAEGLIVETMTPGSHDRMVAETIVLSHFIGRMIDGARLTRHAGATAAYRHLQSVVDVATHDSFQLLHDLWTFNPHSRPVLRRLLRSAGRLHARLR